MQEWLAQLLAGRPLDEVVPAVIGLLLLGSTAAWSLALVVCGLTARWWPTAEGEIVEWRLQTYRGRNAVNPTVSLRARYRYEIGGKIRTGGRVYFGFALDGFDQRTARYIPTRTVGARVPVRFFPLATGVCTLETRIAPQLWLALVLSILVSMIVLSKVFEGPGPSSAVPTSSPTTGSAPQQTR